MIFRSVFKIAIFLVILISNFPTQALTTEQFVIQCGKTVEQCQKTVPTQFYLGGILDAIGYLNAELKKSGQPALYCMEEKELFDMQALITFIVTHQKTYLGTNTTNAVLDFIKQEDHCE